MHLFVHALLNVTLFIGALLTVDIQKRTRRQTSNDLIDRNKENQTHRQFSNPYQRNEARQEFGVMRLFGVSH